MAKRVIDLDEARAAREEAEPVTLKYKGDEYTLPAELPFEFAENARKEDAHGALAVLFGDKAEKFFAQSPSITDVEDLTKQIAEVYGLDVPKASASPGS